MAFAGEGSIISGFGTGVETNFNALRANETALRDTMFAFSTEPFHCSTVPDRLLDQHVPDRSHLTKLERMCFHVITETERLNNVSLADRKSLLIISTTKGNIDALEDPEKYSRKNAEYLTEITRTLGKEFKCANEPLLVSNACISGLLGILIANRYIEAGIYENIIVCGADLVTEFTLSGFRSFNAMSNEPCRPFDADRKGINLGEAAAAILITKNKTPIQLISGSSANDANHISGPSKTGDGLLKAIANTLSPTGNKRPDFINAHGTATLYNDEMEAVAFHRAGLDHCPVNSFKGYFGHSLGAAGVLETVLGLESLKQDELIASGNFRNKGTTHLDNVITENKKTLLRSFLKTASGFGGCNAAAFFIKLS